MSGEQGCIMHNAPWGTFSSTENTPYNSCCMLSVQGHHRDSTWTTPIHTEGHNLPVWTAAFPGVNIIPSTPLAADLNLTRHTFYHFQREMVSVMSALDLSPWHVLGVSFLVVSNLMPCSFLQVNSGTFRLSSTPYRSLCIILLFTHLPSTLVLESEQRSPGGLHYPT